MKTLSSDQSGQIASASPESVSQQGLKPMGLLPDWEIQRLALEGMIKPFFADKIRKVDDISAMSYGLGHYGYDLRLSSDQFQIFRRIPGEIINPKNFNPRCLENAPLCQNEYGKYFVSPGNSYSLGFSMEELDIPDDITVQFIGKSTYARCGYIAGLTPGESGWRGHVTFEFSNASPSDCMVFAEEGIVQALFFRGEPCHRTYGNGKYQNQGPTIVTARA